MSVDNRTDINDCEDDAQTFTTSGGALGTNTDAGAFYENTASVESQHANVDDETSTSTDSGGTTLNLNLSDATVYLLIKDNLVDVFANGGAQILIGDGTNRIGYAAGGNDAPGMLLAFYFFALKMDISEQVASPGTNNAYSGTEAGLDQTAVTQFGYGSLHLAKAVGNNANIFMDAFCYIANDSYALTINGGTIGTPETMVDVQFDDVGGLLTGLGYGGMIGNPIGSQFTFFAPTEWGESSPNADHYFTADGEQWFWIGDNAGGYTIGSTHFPFRLVSNATDTGSFVINSCSIVNTGVRAEFLMDDTNFDIIEIDGCSFTGLATISLPLVGGTSRFTTNTIFSDCDQITHNGADLSGSSILNSNVAADEGALFYDETTDPDGEMDDMTFSMGAASHHAIRFGTNVTNDVTLRGIDFTGFGSGDNSNDSIFRFDATGGSLNLNLVGCTTDGAFSVDDAAGVTVTVVIDPVTTLVHVDDNDGFALQFVNVYLKAADNSGPLPFEESVLITRSGTVATVDHTGHGLATGEKVKIEGITDKTEDNAGVHIITVTGVDDYTYPTTDSGSISYTGTIISTAVLISGLTDVNGDVSVGRTFGSNQPVDGFARMSTDTPRFKSFDLAGNEVNSISGVTINVRLVLDE